MPKIVTVFLSSVAAGLEEYRESVYRAIQGLEGYHCVRMEDFGARNSPSVDFCRQKVTDCDVFVGILGHLYGSCPTDSDKSFSEIEYDAAVDANKPRFIFIAPEEARVPFNLTETSERKARQRAFRDKARSDRLSFTYVEDAASGLDLPTSVVLAIHNAQAEIARREPDDSSTEKLTTLLLFPIVTNQSAFDTAIVITNASAAPFGTAAPKGGACILHFYGPGAPSPYSTSVILPGEQLMFTMSGGNPAQLVRETADFQGYLVAECRFPDAHGWAQITNGFGGIPTFASSYSARVIPDNRHSNADSNRRSTQ